MHYKGLIAAAFLLAVPASAAFAQGLTDDEILKRFEIQLEAYTAVRTGKGATRGLTIVSVDELEETAPVGVDVADTGPELDPVADADTPPVEVATGDSTPTPTDGTAVLTEVATDDAPKAIDPTQVGILPEELQVNVRISFDYDSAIIKPDQVQIIDQMCRVMKGSDIKLFRIMGHTDGAGSDAYNEGLSLLRAEEVKRRLVADCGIDAARLEPMGLGERFLADPADPAAAENRRVEFQALS